VIHDAQESSNIGSVSLIPKGSVYKRHRKTATSSVFCKNIWGDSGGEVNILGGDSIDNFEENNVQINICLIMNGYQDRVFFFFNLAFIIS